MRRHVPRAPPLNEPGQRARRRIFRPFRIDANRRAVDDPVAAGVAADDVVVQHRLDGNLVGDGLLRVQARADQPLLLGDVAHEHERRVEVDAALAERPRQLDRQRGPAAVVIDAGRQVVERRRWIGRRRCRRVGIARAVRCVRRALTAGPRDRVVMSADVDAPRTPPRQDGHHVPELDVPRDAALLRHLIRVEADLQLRAVALHLVQNPLARCADAARRRIGGRQRVARLEAFELLERGAQAVRRYRRDERDDARIEVGNGLREKGAAAAAREQRTPSRAQSRIACRGVYGWAGGPSRQRGCGAGLLSAKLAQAVSPAADAALKGRATHREGCF